MPKPTMNEFQVSSYLSGGSAPYLEELYEEFLKNPQAVDLEWRQLFEKLPAVNGHHSVADISHADLRQHFIDLARQPFVQQQVSTDAVYERKQHAVYKLIEAFRVQGHLVANINPLYQPVNNVADLELSTYDLSEQDLDTEFAAPDIMGQARTRLRNIITRLKTIYCGSVGAEYMYITKPNEVAWIQQRLEQGLQKLTYPKERKLSLLQQLNAADGLEKYLGSKFVGQKRFSLEGGDSFVPMLNTIIDRGGEVGVKQAVIGMAHRGRLNVLINVCGQSPDELFKEFEGTREVGLTSGDVKYHLGFSSDVETPGGPVHLSLAFNPSHLEVISSVVLGSVRARLDRFEDHHQERTLAILVHGDSAFAGQGIVMETLNMSQTRAYTIGGAIHIVINNQVGFTTSNHEDTRSSLYCTDIAKMIEAPVFHVNADDPEAVVFLAQLAVDYRNTFKKDVVIDLVCYRRHGHNEADEPRATQPKMYQLIDSHLTPRELYAEKLIKEGVCTQAEVDALFEQYRNALDRREPVRTTIKAVKQKLAEAWTRFLNQDWTAPSDTSIDKKTGMKLAKQLLELPEGFTLQRQISQVMSQRAKMVTGEISMDWGFAENLAYATLLDQGMSIRMTGQDCRRGTFSHRHAALHDQVNGSVFVPLKNLGQSGATIDIYDSLLSEEGVLGFEYGYANAVPQDLVIWEAQFGDFANGAQVIIDQFISSGMQKWNRLCGLVMLLPHGYEGQGPEHSSARLERYLQLCAQHNIQVAVPTTPAQVFHMLRRQVLRPFRAPLIVMSPKSLLRHKLAVSTWSELTDHQFQCVLPEIDKIDPKNVTKIILCSGRVYYDLLEARRERDLKHVAIIRIEQLYPFPYEDVRAALAPYKKASEITWCQEEPKNQGAWFITHHRLIDCLNKNQVLTYAGRSATASTAVGYSGLHKQQQLDLINAAFA